MSYTNNVTRILDSRRIPYQLHEYDYDAGVQTAEQVAAAIGLPSGRVFKSLVVLDHQPNRKPMLVLIPGPETLNLRQFAKAAGIRKARMASHDQAEAMTGLQTGGISPLALLSRGFAVFVTAGALQHETIAVSAGQRGANIELAPDDLVQLTKARVIDLSNQ